MGLYGQSAKTLKHLSVWSIHLRRQIQHYLTLTVNKYNYSIMKIIFTYCFPGTPLPKKTTPYFVVVVVIRLTVFKSLTKQFANIFSLWNGLVLTSAYVYNWLKFLHLQLSWEILSLNESTWYRRRKRIFRPHGRPTAR